ncbi:MAG: tol-pal system-associated acyl-CoA thioesterase [Methyloprofundus sp.]|nr:tol-pal system-associated acyl-CoA thioesterase [Methyloprofundus sp.]
MHLSEKLSKEMIYMANSFQWPVRVYYEDTDAGGVVFYANYLKFYERARTEMLRDMGFEQDELMLQEGVIFVVRSVQVDYLKPAKFNDLISVSANLSLVKSASLTFEQIITRADDTLSKATIRIACLDAKSLRPKHIPDKLKRALNYE